MWIQAKTRHDFRKNMHEKEPDNITLHLQLGEVHLESIRVQADHLQQFYFPDPEEQERRTRGPPEAILTTPPF